MNIIYKVAPPGEGKTAWLVGEAFKESNNGKKLYLYYLATGPAGINAYLKFVTHYYEKFNRVCPVLMASNIEDIDTNDAIVFIDDVFKHNFNILELRTLLESCERGYVTINGKLHP